MKNKILVTMGLIAALMARQSAVLALATARADAAVPCPTYSLPAARLHRPSRPLPFLRSLAALLRARRALGRIVRDFRPDIIHANGIAAVLALPSAAGLKTNFCPPMERSSSMPPSANR